MPVKNWLRNAGSKRKAAYYAKKRAAAEKEVAESGGEASSVVTPRSAREPGAGEPRVISGENADDGE